MRLDNEPLHPLNGLATIHAGQTVHLSCSAKGGNPTPITTIYINGESYTYDPDLQWSHTLQFVASYFLNTPLGFLEVPQKVLDFCLKHFLPTNPSIFVQCNCNTVFSLTIF